MEDWIRQSDQFAHYAAAIAAGTKGDHYPKPPESIRTFAAEIDDLLRDITVCDPAIGSGAFPVGMMTEIVRARVALTPYFNDVAERTPYYFKRHAIQSCIYGADIDAGAVEIAKLRLWLSLVVDEEDVQQIKPLPNLDYKIVVGNSLFGVEKTLFNNDQFKQLETLKPKFFDESNRTKKAEYKRQIEKLIHELTNGREAFDFEIYFSEVFHANGGFDVVIANPPYVVGIQTEMLKQAMVGSSIVWMMGYKGAVDWLTSTLIDLAVIESMLGINKRHINDRDKIFEKFTQAIARFNPKYHIAEDRKENPMTLLETLSLVIHPRGQGKQPIDMISALYDFKWISEESGK